MRAFTDPFFALTAFLVTLSVLLSSLIATQWWHRRTLWQQWQDVEQRGSQTVPNKTTRPISVSLLKRLKPSEHKEQPDLAQACMEVAARLRSGESTAAAWDATWSRMSGQPAGEVDAEGVPHALTKLEGEVPELVVAAIRFSHNTGAPLRDVLTKTAAGLTEKLRAEDAQKIAFAGSKLSARVLTALPLVGLIGAELLGAGPLKWIVSGPVPLVIGATGLALTVTGHLVSKRMIAKAQKTMLNQSRAPMLADLAVAGLAGGNSIPGVLQALGVSLRDENLGRIAQELRLGATWQEAFTPTPKGSELLRQGLQAAWQDGIFAIELVEQLAATSRAKVVADAQVAAEKLAVRLAVPLGSLLLPAFVLLGLVPVILSLFGGKVVVG